VPSRLLDVGSAVATPLKSASAAKVQRTRFGNAAAVARLDAAVDALSADAVHATAAVVLCGRAARRWHRA
jgi:cob(I)alamin adenosyltransferase